MFFGEGVKAEILSFVLTDDENMKITHVPFIIANLVESRKERGENGKSEVESQTLKLYDKNMATTLEESIEKASKLKIVQLYESKWRLFAYNFMIGTAHGLGVFFGASVTVALLIIFLSEFQWVPIVGDFIVQLLVYLKDAYGQTP